MTRFASLCKQIGSETVARSVWFVELSVSNSNLKNIAISDYWENTAWADEIGVGGTRVHVLSRSNGWIWFNRGPITNDNQYAL